MTVVVIFFLVLANTVASVIKDQRLRQNQIDANNRALNIVRYAMSLIRQTQPSANGAYPIVNATNTSLTFYTTMNGGPAIQRVRLFLNGTSIQQGVIQPTGNPVTYPAGNEVVTTILQNVQNGGQPLFRYYDSSYTGSQSAMNPITATNIRVVQMNILYDTNTAQPPGATTISLSAQLRNLKDNY